jgi:hypothetical protein
MLAWETHTIANWMSLAQPSLRSSQILTDIPKGLAGVFGFITYGAEIISPSSVIAPLPIRTDTPIPERARECGAGRSEKFASSRCCSKDETPRSTSLGRKGTEREGLRTGTSRATAHRSDRARRHGSGPTTPERPLRPISNRMPLAPFWSW